MPSTGLDKNPYPNTGDAPDGPGAFLAFAQRLSLLKGAGVAYCDTTAARNALVTNGDAYDGLHVYDAETGFDYIYKAGWKLVSTNGPVAFVPTWTNLTPGSSTVVANYTVHGGAFTIVVRLTYGTGFSIAASPAEVTFTTPFNMLDGMGTGRYFRSGTGNIDVETYKTTTTSVIVRGKRADSVYNLSVPLGDIPEGSGDELLFNVAGFVA